MKPEEKKEKTIYDDEFDKLLAEAEGVGEITDGDIDVLAGETFYMIVYAIRNVRLLQLNRAHICN